MGNCANRLRVVGKWSDLVEFLLPLVGSDAVETYHDDDYVAYSLGDVVAHITEAFEKDHEIQTKIWFPIPEVLRGVCSLKSNGAVRYGTFEGEHPGNVFVVGGEKPEWVDRFKERPGAFMTEKEWTRRNWGSSRMSFCEDILNPSMRLIGVSDKDSSCGDVCALGLGFSTRFSPPMDWLAAVARNYPGLRMRVSWVSDSNGPMRYGYEERFGKALVGSMSSQDLFGLQGFILDHDLNLGDTEAYDPALYWDGRTRDPYEWE